MHCPSADFSYQQARTKSAAAVLRGKLRGFTAEFEDVVVYFKSIHYPAKRGLTWTHPACPSPYCRVPCLLLESAGHQNKQEKVEKISKELKRRHFAARITDRGGEWSANGDGGVLYSTARFACITYIASESKADGGGAHQQQQEQEALRFGWVAFLFI